MRPQDIVVLVKIFCLKGQKWTQIKLAHDLHISQSEISESIKRSQYAGLLDQSGRVVATIALMEFLEYGLRYVFPARAGHIARGLPTAYAAPPLSAHIVSEDELVWSYAHGTHKGETIVPLYPTVPQAVENDSELYEYLALIDALRVGRARERQIAVAELKQRFGHGE